MDQNEINKAFLQNSPANVTCEDVKVVSLFSEWASGCGISSVDVLAS